MLCNERNKLNERMNGWWRCRCHRLRKWFVSKRNMQKFGVFYSLFSRQKNEKKTIKIDWMQNRWIVWRMTSTNIMFGNYFLRPHYVFVYCYWLHTTSAPHWPHTNCQNPNNFHALNSTTQDTRTQKQCSSVWTARFFCGCAVVCCFWMLQCLLSTFQRSSWLLFLN